MTIKMCWHKSVSNSTSLEGEFMRKNHPEIPYADCLRCSGYKSESKGCQYYEGREVFTLEEEQPLDSNEQGLVGRTNEQM